MPGPGIASQLTPNSAQVFAPGSWPLLQGYIEGANLTCYARLWSPAVELIWNRPMLDLAPYGYPGYHQYQTLGPGTTETKRITFGLGVTGGYWAIRYHDVTTDWIAWGETNEQIIRKIAAHPDLNDYHPVLSYNATTRVLDISFAYDRAGLNIDDFAVVNALTGSGNLSANVTTPVSGTGDFSSHYGGQGHYFWDMIVWDGTAWSGGSTVSRSALAPSWSEFWVDGPATVNMLIDGGGGGFDPVENVEVDIASVTPAFIWTISPMDYAYIASQEIGILDNDTGELIPIGDLGKWRTQDRNVRRYDLPYGVLNQGNGAKYRWYYLLGKQSGVMTQLSGIVEVVMAQPPAPTNLVANWVADANGAPISFGISWTLAADDQFLDTVFRMREAGTVSRSVDDVILGYRSDPATPFVNIVEYPINTDMILSISQRARRNGKIVEGPAAEYAFRANWDGAMLTEVYSQTIRTLSLPYHRGRTVRGVTPTAYAQVLNSADPVAIHSRAGKGRRGEINAVLTGAFPDGWRAMHDLVWEMYENAAGQTLLWRDALGGMRNMLYCQIDEPVFDIEGGGKAPTVTIPYTRTRRAALELPT